MVILKNCQYNSNADSSNTTFKRLLGDLKIGEYTCKRLVLLSGALRKVTKLTYSDIDFLAVKVFRVASCRSGVKLEEATDR